MNIDERKHVGMIKLFKEGHHEHMMVNLGQPPGRALFNVKSRTYLASWARCNI
jgi:hypothetical protein